MSKAIVETLAKTAVLDSRQLHSIRTINRDRPEVPRDIDFLFYTDDQKQADTVASFVTDYRYGKPSVQRVTRDGGKVSWRLLIVVHAPATDQIVHSVSGFMACLGLTFGLEYDGWGCTVQALAIPPPLPPQ